MLKKTVCRKLNSIALARSGDKGDMCNVGVIARSREAFDFLGTILTTEKVKALFKGIASENVDRFVVENLLSFNFLLHESLGGGGTKSLQIDPQGKTYSQALLNCEFDIPVSVLESVKD